MRKTLRATGRLIALAITTYYYYVQILPALWFRRKNPGRAYGLQQTIMSRWCRACGRIMGMQVTVEGTPPQEPFILVTNHLGYMDIHLLGACCPGWFVAKSELRGWPLMGHIMSLAPVLFINRNRKRDIARVHTRMDERLAGGQGLIFFPEGTSTRGEAVLPFKSSLLQLAVQSRTPVSYATIRYACPDDEPPAHLAVCWWGDMTFGPHFLDLLKVKSFSASLIFGNTAFWNEDRKILAAQLREAVAENFVPVVRKEGS